MASTVGVRNPSEAAALKSGASSSGSGAHSQTSAHKAAGTQNAGTHSTTATKPKATASYTAPTSGLSDGDQAAQDFGSQSTFPALVQQWLTANDSTPFGATMTTPTDPSRSDYINGVLSSLLGSGSSSGVSENAPGVSDFISQYLGTGPSSSDVQAQIAALGKSPHNHSLTYFLKQAASDIPEQTIDYTPVANQYKSDAQNTAQALAGIYGGLANQLNSGKNDINAAYQQAHDYTTGENQDAANTITGAYQSAAADNAKALAALGIDGGAANQIVNGGGTLAQDSANAAARVAGNTANRQQQLTEQHQAANTLQNQAVAGSRAQGAQDVSNTQQQLGDLLSQLSLQQQQDQNTLDSNRNQQTLSLATSLLGDQSNQQQSYQSSVGSLLQQIAQNQPSVSDAISAYTNLYGSIPDQLKLAQGSSPSLSDLVAAQNLANSEYNDQYGTYDQQNSAAEAAQNLADKEASSNAAQTLSPSDVLSAYSKLAAASNPTAAQTSELGTLANLLKAMGYPVQ